MSVKITSTKNQSKHVKALVYGRAGVGKTKLIATAPKPIIMSAEAGLLSVSEFDIPVIEISSIDDVIDSYNFFKDSEDATQYQTLCLDSISEIAEVLLAEFKVSNKDPRAAYGQLNDTMSGLIRNFRDLKGFHVYFTAKEGKIVDDTSGLTSYYPVMPGKTLVNSLPFFFDEVLAMRIGQTDDGDSYRYLQTQPDMQYEAKDRSGKLKMVTKPDLTSVFKQILKPTVKQTKES